MEGRRCATAATQQRQRSKAKFLNPNHASRNSATLPKHIHTYIHTYIHIHYIIHAYIDLHTCVHLHTSIQSMTYKHACMQISIYAFIHTYMYACMCIPICVHPSIHPSICVHPFHPSSFIRTHIARIYFFFLSWPIFATKTKIENYNKNR